MDEMVKIEGSVVVFPNGSEYPLVASGRLQSRQVTRLTKWIAKYGVPVLESFRDESLESASGLQFIFDFMQAIDEDAMLEAFKAVIGCTDEEAELYFDFAVLVEAIEIIYNEQPTVKRLISRFFSVQSTESEGEDKSSTQSEPPTDGQTTKS